MAYLGLDIGTTRCKAGIFDSDGQLLVSASREYGYSSPHPGWAEQDPLEVWELAKEILKEVAQKTPVSPRFLSISTQGEAVIFLDEADNILRPAILGMDMRSVEQCMKLASEFGQDQLLAMAGVPLHPITSLAKILWVKENQPDIFAKTKKFLFYEDFMLWKLGGIQVIDYSMACKTMLFDIRSKEWSPQILDYLEIETNQLAQCLPSGEIVGKVDKKMADELGLPEDLQIVSGGHDVCCAALGSGSVVRGIAADVIGTAEIFSLPVDDYRVVLQIEPHSFSCYDHVIPGKYMLATINQTAGLLLRWYRDTFRIETLKEEIEKGISSYQILIDRAKVEPAHIFVLPHLVGSGTPWIDPLSKAAILGITLNTDEGEIIRAILESIVFEQKVSIELFEENGVFFNEIRAVGGCARSPFWLQIRADILGKPVSSLVFEDASVLGAAMLAAFGGGDFSSLEEIAQGWVKIKETYFPDEEKHKFYQERFEVYKELYPALKEVNHKI